jgi:hypothetical protein
MTNSYDEIAIVWQANFASDRNLEEKVICETETFTKPLRGEGQGLRCLEILFYILLSVETRAVRDRLFAPLEKSGVF